jgi:hypothetical protein
VETFDRPLLILLAFFPRVEKVRLARVADRARRCWLRLPGRGPGSLEPRTATRAAPAGSGTMALAAQRSCEGRAVGTWTRGCRFEHRHRGDEDRDQDSRGARNDQQRASFEHGDRSFSAPVVFGLAGCRLLQSCGGACRMNGCNILTECAPDRLHGTGGAASRWRGLIEGGHRVAATSSLQALDRRRQQAYSAERRASASAEATIETIERSAAMAASSWRSVLE